MRKSALKIIVLTVLFFISIIVCNYWTYVVDPEVSTDLALRQITEGSRDIMVYTATKNIIISVLAIVYVALCVKWVLFPKKETE
jgi:hypothetical protein